MSFFTKMGDDGTTGLLGKGRVKKYDLRMETIGCLDEVSASLGICRAFSSSNEIQEVILSLQKQLYLMMSEIASERDVATKFSGISNQNVLELEKTIELIGQKVKIPKEFIVPGDTKGGAFLSLARTIVRRAERRMVELVDSNMIENKELLKFINRLSSLLFTLELYENQISGKGKQTLVK